ncbi:hypothetical protein JOD54_001213 [Actinokineospora baliensis]|nr:hypothetical protein [Actinokineospora baliensis]
MTVGPPDNPSPPPSDERQTTAPGVTSLGEEIILSWGNTARFVVVVATLVGAAVILRVDLPTVLALVNVARP